MKLKPGTKAFEVEWCVELPVENGDCYPDRAQYRRQYLRNRSLAIAFARGKLPDDQFGAVRMTPVVWQDKYPDTELRGRVYGWEVIGDSEEISQ